MNVKPYPTPNQGKSNTSKVLLIILLVFLFIGNCILGYLYFAERNTTAELKAQVVTTQNQQIDSYVKKNERGLTALTKTLSSTQDSLKKVTAQYNKQVSKNLRARYNKPRGGPSELVSKADTTLRKSRVYQLLDREEIASQALAQLDSCERTMFQVVEIQQGSVLTLQKGISDLGYSLADRPIILQPWVEQSNPKSKPRFGFIHGVITTAAFVAGAVLQAQISK